MGTPVAEQTATAAQIIRDYERRKADRATFETTWQRVNNLVLPDRADFLVKRAPGVRRMQHVYDATPIMAASEYANGMHGLMTSPYVPWKYVQADDDRLMLRDDCRFWFAYANRWMDTQFSGAQSGFTNACHEYWLDQATIGTGFIDWNMDWPRGLRFACRSMNGVTIAEDHNERVTMMTREFHFTRDQVLSKFLDKAPDDIKRSTDESKKWRFLFDVRPRLNRDPQSANTLNMTFASVWTCVDTKEQLSESGFIDQQFACCRYSLLSDEIYGRSLAIQALPDIQELNNLYKMVVKSAEKQIDPPLMVQEDAFITPIKTYPGSLNYWRKSTAGQAAQPLVTQGRVDIGQEMISAKQRTIMRQFHADWMMLPVDPENPDAAGKGVTATYTLQDRDNKMRMLSPMMGRQETEFLGPVVDGVFNAGWRRSVLLKFDVTRGSPFPPPPSVLSGQRLRTRYISPVATAQRSASLDSTQRLLETATTLAPFDETIKDVINSEGLLRYEADVLNCPPEALRTVEQLMAKRQAQAKQQQMEMAEQMAGAAQEGTGAIKNVAQAGALMGGAGAGPSAANPNGRLAA